MDISLSSEPLDVAFHPSTSSNLLATGLISGKVQLYDFKRAGNTTSSLKKGTHSAQAEDTDDDSESDGASLDSNSKGKNRLYDRSWSVRPSNKSCRGVAFSTEGDSLYTLAKDGSIFRLDTETGSVVSKWDKAHSSAPSRILPIEQNLFASGDDDGVISLWDPRRPTDSNSAVRTYSHHFDWITSMLWCTHLAPPKTAKLTKEEQEKKKLREEKKRKRKQKKSNLYGEDEEEEEANVTQTQRERLVVTSGDGTLSVIDVRAGKSGAEVSEDQEDELLSIASVKQNSKLVVGTQLGILSLWAPTKGLLDHVDRIPGHPASVDTMCTLDDDTILTGSSDGLVRVVQILPHKLLGIVADHGGMPVERIARCGSWMASIGHGAEIKLTDLAPLLEEDDGEDDEDGEAQALGVTNLSAVNADNSSDEEDGEPENDGGEDVQELEAYSQAEGEEGDSSEDERQQRSNKKAKSIASILRPPTLSEEGAAAVDFFADL